CRPPATLFQADPVASSMWITTFRGVANYQLSGFVSLALGTKPTDCVSATNVKLVASSSDTGNQLMIVNPMLINLRLDDKQPSVGSYDAETGGLKLDLYLISDSGPLPMPLHLDGVVHGDWLVFAGANGDIHGQRSDAVVQIAVHASKVAQTVPGLIAQPMPAQQIETQTLSLDK